MRTKLKKISTIKAGLLLTAGFILCMIVFISLAERNSTRKNALINGSRDCDCTEAKEEINLLHAIPLLLLPAFKTADSDDVSIDKARNVLCATAARKKCDMKATDI